MFRGCARPEKKTERDKPTEKPIHEIIIAFKFTSYFTRDMFIYLTCSFSLSSRVEIIMFEGRNTFVRRWCFSFALEWLVRSKRMCIYNNMCVCVFLTFGAICELLNTNFLYLHEIELKTFISFSASEINGERAFSGTHNLLTHSKSNQSF